MHARSGRRTALGAGASSLIILTCFGTSASARPAPAGPATRPPAVVAAEVRAAVSLHPTDVVVAVDSAPAINSMRETAKTLTRAARQRAAAAAAVAFAATKGAVLHGRAGVTTTRDYAQLPVQLVRIDSPAALEALSRTAGVVSLSLPHRRTLDASANLELISQPTAVASGATGAGTRVAILDSGVDYTRAGAETTFGDCGGGPGTGSCRIKAHYDVTHTGLLDVDRDGHGTNVSGIVATVAPAADLSVYNVFDTSLGAFDSDILDALNHVAATAAATNTRSVNLSLGDSTHHTSACTASAYTSVFATLRAVGVLPVVAAGNAADDGAGFTAGVAEPACAPGALPVGAVYSETGPAADYGVCSDAAPVANQITCFSQSGPLLGLLAPGARITAAGITMSGTSQAAPHVAAAVAMLAAVRPAANPTGVSTALTSTGLEIADPRTTPATYVRRLDVPAAITAVAALLPDAPTSVAAAAGAASATVTWVPGPGGAAATGFTAVATPGGAACSATGAASCVVPGLANGTAYTVTVTATNAFGGSAPSAPSAAVIPLSVPGAPVSVTAAAGAGVATVFWRAPAETGGSPVTGFTAVAIPGGASCTTAALSCGIGGLTNGTAYTFIVAATNALGGGPASLSSAAVVPATVPGAPAPPAVVRGNAGVDVAWLPVADTGGSAITNYTAVATPGTSSCSSAGAGCHISGLANGTSYTVSVTATNALGAGAPSPPSAAVVPATTPAQPLRIVVQRGHRLAVVAWTAPPDGGSKITGYRVVASPGGRSCVTTGALRCVVTGLVDGRAYRFIVTAANAIGAGGATPPSAPAVPIPVPGIPAAPKVVRGNLRVTVSWAAPAANGTAPITGYRVVATPGGRTCTATVVRRCVVTGLVNGRAYRFTVVALNRIGASPTSLATSAVPAAPPSAVRSLTAAFPAASQTLLRWIAPAAVGGLPLVRYEFRTSADGGRTWGRWITAGTATSATIRGLAKGRLYVVQVRAVTGAGPGVAAGKAFRPTR